MALPAGLLRHQLLFQRNTTPDAQDEFGQGENWQTAFTVPGAYEPQPSRPQGAEFERAQKRQAENRVFFRIRYRANIDDSLTFVALHRIIFRNRTWNILRAFDPEEDGHPRVEIRIEAIAIN